MCDDDKDDLRSNRTRRRKEITSLVTALATTFENIVGVITDIVKGRDD